MLLPQRSDKRSRFTKLIRDSVRDQICVSTSAGQHSPRLLHDVVSLCYAIEGEVSVCDRRDVVNYLGYVYLPLPLLLKLECYITITITTAK